MQHTKTQTERKQRVDAFINTRTTSFYKNFEKQKTTSIWHLMLCYVEYFCIEVPDNATNCN